MPPSALKGCSPGVLAIRGRGNYKEDSMRFLKTGAGRWIVPAALAAVLATALLVTPVIGASNGVSAKKVNKTINKKTNATELSISGIRSVGTSSTTLGTLELGQGSYL